MWHDVAFGSGKAGLATVGYRQYDTTGGDAVARTTTGVIEIGQGAYGADVPRDAATVGIEWDTGEGTPIYAHEDLRTNLPVTNTPLGNIPFLFVSSGDHVTPVTGATGIAVTRQIDGGAWVAATGTVAEIGFGLYVFDASQADMNGGKITFRITATGGTPAAPDDRFITVITEAGV